MKQKIKPVRAWIAVNKTNGEFALDYVSSHKLGVVNDMAYFDLQGHVPVRVIIRPVTKARKPCKQK